MEPTAKTFTVHMIQKLKASGALAQLDPLRALNYIRQVCVEAAR